MEHNVIRVLLNARAADQRRKLGRLGVRGQALFVLVSIAVMVCGFLLWAVTRVPYPG